MRHHYNYHCFINGKKVIKRFMPDALPGEPWIKGNGTPSDEARANVTAGIRRVISGVPKSAEQKAKMSAASKGKPKSALHKQHMSESHLRRLYGDKE
jgi:hypothetical protein